MILKTNKTELFKKNGQNDTNKIKFDIVKYSLANDRILKARIQSNDRILKARIQSAKMCSVKEIASKKVEYVQYYVPLSAYDETNYKTYNDKINFTKNKYQRTKIESEFDLRNFRNYENN